MIFIVIGSLATPHFHADGASKLLMLGTERDADRRQVKQSSITRFEKGPRMTG